MKPFNAPSAAPSASAPRIASGRGSPRAPAASRNCIATQTPIAPTERLRPPVTITTIIEKPIMMSIAMVRPSVNRLNGEPKPGVPNAKTAPKMRISATRPNSLVSRKRVHPGGAGATGHVARRQFALDHRGALDGSRRVHATSFAQSQ